MPSPQSARPLYGMPSRNKTEGFAARTRKNLDFTIAAHEQQLDVHVVTQVVLSLLGIVVFPFERIIKGSSHQWPLVDLQANGWPAWSYLGDSEPPLDLSKLMENLRHHATAHGNVSFSSDSRALSEVTITFMNRRPPRLGGGEWRASIRGNDLLQFCRLSLDLLDDISV